MTTQSITSLMGFIFPFSKRRNHYLQSRESFYEGRNYLSNYERLKSLVSGTSSNNQISTEKSIKFYGLKFGSSLKEAINHLGKPNYVSKRNSLLRKHKTVYYRITIAQVKCILQLHFLHDQFFLGLIEIRRASEKVKNEITDLIRRKYNIDNDKWFGKIVDESLHTIELKDDIIPHIIYQCGDIPVRKAIKSQLTELIDSRQRIYDKRSDLILEMI